VRYNIRIVSTYPPRKCGIATFSRDLATALSHFTGEVDNIGVAAIDNDGAQYSTPVDLVIDQYNAESWQYAASNVVARAREGTNPTVVLLQHEYGLDPDEDGNDGQGNNFVRITRAFKEAGLTTLVYLHTVLGNPDLHQRTTIRDLGKSSDGLIVTTESAIDILESDTYGIENTKLKHIDHGIRMHHPSQYDRLSIKREFGLQNRFLATTLGLQSPDKGIQYGIRAYARFLDESCTEAQRRKIVYLIAGTCHPEFVKADAGRSYIRYQRTLQQALDECGLRCLRTEQLGNTDLSDCEVVFLDSFLDETTLLRLYSATNVMLLPYLDIEQISSGVLADTLGAGRVAVATKFRYALELINSNRKCPPGLVIGRHARGILIDPGPPSVEQVAQALDYLVFNKENRLRMEKQAQQRGYQMRWHNTAWAILQYIEFVREEQEIVTGRGITFTREKPSSLEISKGTTAG